jgi:hypothetical protein
MSILFLNLPELNTINLEKRGQGQWSTLWNVFSPTFQLCLLISTVFFEYVSLLFLINHNEIRLCCLLTNLVLMMFHSVAVLIRSLTIWSLLTHFCQVLKKKLSFKSSHCWNVSIFKWCLLLCRNFVIIFVTISIHLFFALYGVWFYKAFSITTESYKDLLGK